mgnify:CR=1 FL=1
MERPPAGEDPPLPRSPSGYSVVSKVVPIWQCRHHLHAHSRKGAIVGLCIQHTERLHDHLWIEKGIPAIICAKEPS